MCFSNSSSVSWSSSFARALLASACFGYSNQQKWHRELLKPHYVKELLKMKDSSHLQTPLPSCDCSHIFTVLQMAMHHMISCAMNQNLAEPSTETTADLKGQVQVECNMCLHNSAPSSLQNTRRLNVCCVPEPTAGQSAGDAFSLASYCTIHGRTSSQRHTTLVSALGCQSMQQSVTFSVL